MTHPHLQKILILGCSTKAGTYVAKQFSKSGYEVIVYNWTDLPNKHSRYVSRYIHVESPEADLVAFEEKFLKYLDDYPVYALLPLHDPALELIRHMKSRLPAGLHVMGLNEDKTYRYAHNKWELLKLARDHGIPVPQTVYLSKPEDLHQPLPFGFPCIVKPVSSALVKEGRLYSFSVSVVNTSQELEDKVREVILNVPVMIQEFINGYGIGFNFLAKEGELFNSYIHRRINEHGGVSSYREILRTGAYGNKDSVTSFIKAVRWTGAGMLEFKVQQGVPVLMELNGRFFGSIELSVKSGLNLPQQFLKMYLDGELPPRDQPFREHTKVRNLHDEMLLNLALLAKGKLGRVLKWKFQVWRSVFSAHDFIEDNFFTDPGFVAGLYAADVKRIWGKLRKRFRFRALNMAPHVLKPLQNKPLNIAFICKGNICRSPFAEVYARSINTLHHFHSFGSIAHENRLSPLNALSAAAHFKVSLQGHSSHYLRREDLPLMDVFVVMDKINFFDLLEMGVPPEKIKFLSAQEIPDPYKKNYEYFVEIYSRIKHNLDLILNNEKIS